MSIYHNCIYLVSMLCFFGHIYLCTHLKKFLFLTGEKVVIVYDNGFFGQFYFACKIPHLLGSGIGSLVSLHIGNSSLLDPAEMHDS